MIEAIAVPTLKRAIDFLFDQGGKYLEQIRSHPHGQSPSQNIQETKAEAVSSKAEVSHALIDDQLLSIREAHLESLLRQVATYQRNYDLALEQKAAWGNAMVPPIILNNLSDAGQGLERSIKELQTLTEELTGKQISIPLPQSD